MVVVVAVVWPMWPRRGRTVGSVLGPPTPVMVGRSKPASVPTIKRGPLIVILHTVVVVVVVDWWPHGWVPPPWDPPGWTHGPQRGRGKHRPRELLRHHAPEVAEVVYSVRVT